MILILSGNRQQADYIANKKGLSKGDYKYLSRSEQLRGIKDVKVLLYGFYRDRSDYYDIISELNLLENLKRITIEGGPL